MGTTTEKLQAALESKQAVQAAIESKGVAVTDDFSTYADLIAQYLVNELLKMDKENPTGTGSFSMNRLAGSTVGTKSSTVGDNNEASGDYSHSGGVGCKATATGSNANGYYTKATGLFSKADGENTEATGAYSYAGGSNTKAQGSRANAIGYNTIALDYQHAQGHYNNTNTALAGTTSGTGNGTAFVIGNGTATSGANAFRVNYNGQPYALKAMTTTGCDYAEYFEWQDGNPEAEDRRGYFVTLDGEQIKKAEPGDYILGIVSALPCLIGNGDEDWKGRYILDDFGAFITEEFEYEETVIDKETGKEVTIKRVGTKYKENPDYDPSQPYIQREDRPEWATVGMLGVIAVRDDGTCQVNGYCKVAEGGTATASDTGYRVVARVTDNIVKVIYR